MRRTISLFAVCSLALTFSAAGVLAQDAAASKDPMAPFYELGWQGAPGVNMIYNPDLELGGTGYFYDFSWPKKYEHYVSIRKARPVLLLEGKGVDGGTCALVQGSSLRAYCFPVTVGKTYTFSVDLRAPEGQTTAKALALACDAEWNFALWKNADNIPSDKWTRYSWTVKWEKNNLQKRGYFRIDSDGVLVDRLQVVEGNEKEYQAPPVMLGLVYDRWEYFIRGRDAAKARIKVVPGVKGTGTVAVTVVAKDAWDKVIWTKTFDAPLSKVTEIPMDLPTAKLGLFHVDLTAKQGGKVVGIGLSRYAIMDPPMLEKVAPGQFGLMGICQESFNFPVFLCEDHAKIQTDLGIRLNRLFAAVPPDLAYPIPQEFFDDLLAKAKPFNDAGIDLLPCFDMFPEDVHKNSINLDMPKQADLDKFGKCVKEYVGGLKTGIRAWEIFNEPNLWRMSGGANAGKVWMFPAKYFEFQKVAYKVIKEVDPKIQVVCNALNNLPDDWVNDWVAMGAGDYMDMFSFHAYGWTNCYPTMLELRAKLAKNKFTKPIVNSEKYYGCNLFYDRSGYEETRRGYYLPAKGGELPTAGRSMQLFISLAADGVPNCPFNPTGTLSRRGPGNTIFLYDFFPAYNAGSRFVVEAGKGRMLKVGESLTAFYFPDAKGGPLVVLWASIENVAASMRGLAGDYEVYDIMGNKLSKEELAGGIRIATDPTYLRFKAGATEESVTAAITGSQILGLGDPFRVSASLTGPRQITAFVTCTGSKPMSGKVSLMGLPKDWKTAAPSKSFENLDPGKTITIVFDFDALPLKDMTSYEIAVLAESGDDFVRRPVSLRPLFIGEVKAVKADADLSEWKDATWLTLGEGQLSKDFDPNQKRNGDADISAKVAMGWSADHLALAIVVSDDTHTPAEAPQVGWKGDAIQLYFDPKCDDIAGGGNADDVAYTVSFIGGKAQAWIDKGAEGNFKGAANKAEGLVDGDVQLAAKREGGKTTYEIVLPAAKCLPGAKLAKGGNIRFSLLVNDNDGKGRKVGVTLAPKGREPYGAPQDYLDAIMK